MYTSGSVAPTSSTYYSSAKSDGAQLSLASNGNGRFSLSGGTLSHSSMTTNATTDTAVVRCTNTAYTSAINDKSVSATNSKGAGSYSFSCGGNREFGYEQFDDVHVMVTSRYGGTYTSGSE